MNHLSPDELVDALDGTLGPAAQLHVEQCAVCASEAARLRAILGETQRVTVPDPSPLFWTHFSGRVRAAIAADDAPRATWYPAWLGWRVLAPVGVLALVILALATAVLREPAQLPVVTTAENASEPARELAGLGEQEWATLSDIVGTVDLDAAQDAGIVRLGDVERAALQLSADEQRELVRLLREEMDKAGG